MAYHLNFRSDIHCEEDLLGFDKYIDTLSNMIRDKDFKTPFCIGIFGKWGTGKTSFMRLLEKRLSEDKTEPHAIPVWFNPWRYEKEDHLIIPFLKTIEQEINKHIQGNIEIGKTLLKGLKSAAVKLSEVSSAFAYGIKADCKLGGFGIDLDASKMVTREEELAGRRIKRAKSLSERLSSIYYDIVGELKSAVDEKKFRIVVFIDDLDRCLPDKAVELLEAIKLFLDIEGYLFFIGVDRNVVKKGISYKYRFFEHKEEKETEDLIISPEDYLDKMIQLPLELPTIEPGRKRRFIESLLGKADEFKEHADIIEIGVGENPRSLKRFINLLSFSVSLAETVKENILDDKVESAETIEHKELLKDCFIPLLYIKWSIIVFRFPGVHSVIKGNWRKLIELQDAATDEGQAQVSEDNKKEKTGIQIDERLKKVLLKGKPFSEDEWLIERFIHLTESTVVIEKARDASKGYSRSYKPGDMVLIPKGRFLYGDDKIEKVIDKDYYVDVFPVTNRQYKEFIDDNKDYEVPHREEDWAKLYNWDKETRNYPEGMEDHPVVLVSYDDAVEFCEWRSKKDGREYRLPTEEEWEKAARGTDAREYPWGNEFDKEKCNTSKSGIKRTTPVTRYIDGTSPFDCYDMAGNVWEWTDSWYDNKKQSKVPHGGSWDFDQYFARCAYRFRFNPYVRLNNIGFRCARTK